MATSEGIYTHPTSPKRKETKEAKKGDVEEIEGEEHESQGTSEDMLKAKDFGKPGDKAVWSKDPDKKKNPPMEFMRRKPKEEVPTS